MSTNGPCSMHSITGQRRGRRLMASFRDGRTHERAVTAVISGNRPLEIMQGQQVRFAGYDGRLPDLASGLPACRPA